MELGIKRKAGFINIFCILILIFIKSNYIIKLKSKKVKVRLSNGINKEETLWNIRITIKY
jgi:hypothetical protein